MILNLYCKLALYRIVFVKTEKKQFLFHMSKEQQEMQRRHIALLLHHIQQEQNIVCKAGPKDNLTVFLLHCLIHKLQFGLIAV